MIELLKFGGTLGYEMTTHTVDTNERSLLYLKCNDRQVIFEIFFRYVNDGNFIKIHPFLNFLRGFFVKKTLLFLFLFFRRPPPVSEF